MVRFHRAVSATLLIILALVIDHPTTARDDDQTLCRVFVPDLVSKCAQYARGPGPVSNPSQDCCRVIKNTDVGCACARVNWFIERLVNMKKVVYVARSCGLKLRPGTKCGSFKIPGN